MTSLSSVRVILTCGPSGHSEERDEREGMILRELNLSALMAATPSEATSDPTDVSLTRQYKSKSV